MQYIKTKRLISSMTTALILFPMIGNSTGQLKVYAVDTARPGYPPPDTTAILDGTWSLDFEANNSVNFLNLQSGAHTVEVHTATSGFLIRQSPDDPDAVDDPTSGYGNPREFIVVENEITSDAFRFDPCFSVSAIVRDGWTMERLEAVDIEFSYDAGTSNIAVFKYPETASYATDWQTDAQGRFPTNTILYLDDYDLQLSKSGYVTFSSNHIITHASVGDTLDLGTLFLYPVDANTNQISDAWETMYFGSGNPVAAADDADVDGTCNRDEYVAGTDPTNQLHGLWLEIAQGTNGLELIWNTEADRTYCISGTTNLCSSNGWKQVGGPWEATSNPFKMVWVETNMNLSWHNSYRVDVVPSSWNGTNSVLINTNPPYSSRGGSTTNWPSRPPLP